MRHQRWLIRTPAVALVIAAVLFAASGILSLWSLRSVAADSEWVDHTHQVLEELAGTLKLVTDARHHALSFALTGQPKRLEMIRGSLTGELLLVDRIALLTADNAHQQEPVTELRRLVEGEAAWQRSLLRSRNPSAVRTMVESSSSAGRFERFQQVIGGMENEERALLRQRSERRGVSVSRTMSSAIAGDLVIIALVTAAVMMSRRSLLKRRRAEDRLALANVELTQRLADLQERSSELALLGVLAENLQTCEGTADVDRVVDNLLPRLFPHSRGAVFLVKRSTEIVPQTAWPLEAEGEYKPFHWQECLGMSRFALHRSEGEGPVCAHIALAEGQSAICVPMLARGEPIGLLHFRWTDPRLRVEELVRTVAEQLGLAYANLSLHETLRRQAVRDPLTGVFNRRYMEESLEREIHRATRHSKPLAVLLIDLDRFKEFNDALGHAAGDELLHEIAGIMERMVRAEDIVCRYGGDEFVIIMPDADGRVVAARANSLMDQVAGRSLHPGAEISVTMSIGVAMFPADGADARALLKSADDALYEAKRGGRGRVLHA